MKRVGLASPINHDFHVLLLHPKQLLSQLLPHHVRHASEEVCGSLGPRRNWSIDLTTRHEVTPSWDPPHLSTHPPPHPKNLTVHTLTHLREHGKFGLFHIFVAKRAL